MIRTNICTECYTDCIYAKNEKKKKEKIDLIDGKLILKIIIKIMFTYQLYKLCILCKLQRYVVVFEFF